MSRLKFFVAVLTGTLFMTVSVIWQWIFTENTIDTVLFVGIIVYFLGISFAYLVEALINGAIERGEKEVPQPMEEPQEITRRVQEPTLFTLDKDEWNKDKRIAG